MSYYFDGDGNEEYWKERLHIFRFEEGRSAAEIPTAIRLLAAAAQEWRADLGFIACSMDVKQIFDNVSPESLSLVMKEMGTAKMLAGSILREQIGGIQDICFKKTTVTGKPSEEGRNAHACST